MFGWGLDISKLLGYSLIDGSIVTQSVADVEASSACLGVSRADALLLFQRLLPAEFLNQLLEKEKLRENNRVYTVAAVMWLMISQRLQGNGPMEQAVLELVRGLPASFWPKPCKRLREAAEGEGRELSSHTGAYNKARQKLPVSVVEQSCDRMFAALIQEVGRSLPEEGRGNFFFDGSSVRTAHSEQLKQAYPPGSNQHGESHWPLLRILVAHDLETGLAMRPVWGPMNGEQAVSEQGLFEEAVAQLPKGAVVVGDANFGVFSVAYAADQRGHPVVLRLTPERAQYLAGGPVRDGLDRRIDWRPSRWDRRSHPELPRGACVRGRLIVSQVQPGDGKAPFLLCLFATLEEAKDEIIQRYGKRWNIETDLRTLKGTLHLEELSCTTPAMVAKEIDLAMAAYNLVRAVTYQAAQKAGVPPRSFSFTRVQRVVNAFAPLMATAQSERQAERYFRKMMYYVGQAQLPQRRRARPSYPRAVWRKPQSFPTRKG